MKTLFTADSHFGHANIIKYSNRPYSDVDEMDNKMIHNWNQVVAPDDVVYHLGDFSMGQKQASEYRKRLNGTIHLIAGNHDKKALREKELFASVNPILEIEVREGDLFAAIVLCHYSMKIWNHAHHGSWHLFGHSHGSLADDPQSLSFDIGVDCWNYFPVSLYQIKARMDKKTYKSIDHHGRSDRFDAQPR